MDSAVTTQGSMMVAGFRAITNDVDAFTINSVDPVQYSVLNSPGRNTALVLKGPAAPKSTVDLKAIRTSVILISMQYIMSSECRLLSALL